MTVTIGRRDLLAALGGTAAAWPLAARAQQGAPMRRIGVLMGFAESDPNAQHLVAAFRSALANLGQMEGSNVLVELRWAAGDTSKMRTFARELVELRLDVIVAQTTRCSAPLPMKHAQFQSCSRLSRIQSAWASRRT